MESGEDYVVGEIEKTKRKLRDISNILETQQQLLRLIVQVWYYMVFSTFMLPRTVLAENGNQNRS